MIRSGDESKPSDKASIEEVVEFYLEQVSSARKDNPPSNLLPSNEFQSEFKKNLEKVEAKELRSITQEGIYQENQVPRVLSTRVYEPRSITSTSNYQKVQSSTYPRMLPNGRPDSDEIDKWLEGIKIKNKELDSQVQKKQEKLESLRSQRSRIDVTSQIAASDPVPSEYGYESGQLSRNSSLLRKLFEDEKITIKENEKLKPSPRITELPSAPTLLSRESQNTSYQRQHQQQQYQRHQQQYQQYPHQHQQHPNQQYQQYPHQHQQYQQYPHQHQQYQQYPHQQNPHQHPSFSSRGMWPQMQSGPVSNSFFRAHGNLGSGYLQNPRPVPPPPAYHIPSPQYSSAPSPYRYQAENASLSSLTSQADTVKSRSPRNPLSSESSYLRDETLGDATQVSTKISDYGSAPQYPSASSSYDTWFKKITMTEGSSESKSPSEPPIIITEAGAEIFYSKPVYLNLINPEEIVSSESKLSSSSGLSSPSESLVKIPEAMVGGEEAIFSVKKELEAQIEIDSSEGGKSSKSASAENSLALVPLEVTPEELQTILPQTPEHNHRPEEKSGLTEEPPKSKNVRYDYKCLSFLSNGLSNIYNGVVSIYNNFPSLPDRFNFKKTMNKNEAGGESSEELPTKSLSKKEEEKASGFFWRKFAIFSRNNDDNNTQKAR